jgi:catechol 2,3-dioxygenase-like lactoylglutathione lyase family enzyme
MPTDPPRKKEERTMTAHSTAQLSGIRTVGVPVSDQARATAFYVETLGLEKRVDFPLGDDRRWIEVAPAGAPTTIALIASQDGLPAGVETGIRLTTTNADAFHAGLIQGGVDADEVLRWPGVPPMFAFRDQDGNGLEIVEDAPA